MPPSVLAGACRRTIEDIKQEILRRAGERQALIARGEYDVPLHYAPLPLPELVDLMGQLAYRRDALALAVPPFQRPLAARCKRALKSAVCKLLRWLFIRQVEYNSAALEVLGELVELLGRIDRNENEFAAALTAIKLQVHALAGRLGQLEQCVPGSEWVAPPVSSKSVPSIQGQARTGGAALIQGVPFEMQQAYLGFLRGPGPVLVLGCGQGELVKLLLSEGVAVQGVDADAGRVEFGRERDLPVTLMEPARFLEETQADSLSAIVVDGSDRPPGPAALAELFGRAWSSLRKSGYLVVQARTPIAAGDSLPAELLSYLLESQGFTVTDVLLGAPLHGGIDGVARRSRGRPFSLSDYRLYAIVGRK